MSTTQQIAERLAGRAEACQRLLLDACQHADDCRTLAELLSSARTVLVHVSTSNLPAEHIRSSGEALVVCC
jgi:hypothetical protein